MAIRDPINLQLKIHVRDTTGCHVALPKGVSKEPNRKFVWPLGEMGKVSVLLSHVVAPRSRDPIIPYLEGVTETWDIDVAQIIQPDYEAQWNFIRMLKEAFWDAGLHVVNESLL